MIIFHMQSTRTEVIKLEMIWFHTSDCNKIILNKNSTADDNKYKFILYTIRTHTRVNNIYTCRTVKKMVGCDPLCIFERFCQRFILRDEFMVY